MYDLLTIGILSISLDSAIRKMYLNMIERISEQRKMVDIAPIKYIKLCNKNAFQ